MTRRIDPYANTKVVAEHLVQRADAFDDDQLDRWSAQVRRNTPYEDRRPNRVPGQPETRYYRFRYRLKGEAVGQYSEVTSVVVGG